MVSREEDEDPTYIISEPILIDKTDSELSQTDRLIAEHGKMLVKSVHCGGIAPDPNREHSIWNCRSIPTPRCPRLTILAVMNSVKKVTAMKNIDYSIAAGIALKYLIKRRMKPSRRVKRRLGFFMV